MGHSAPWSCRHPTSPWPPLTPHSSGTPDRTSSPPFGKIGDDPFKVARRVVEEARAAGFAGADVSGLMRAANEVEAAMGIAAHQMKARAEGYQHAPPRPTSQPG